MMVERTERRRQDDRAALAYIESTIKWVKRGPRVLVLVFGIMTGGAGAASWLGATASSPSHRLNTLEVKVDSGFRSINDDIAELRDEQRRAGDARAEVNEKLDVLLRIGCPSITRADLIRACRDQGAIPR